MSGYTAPHRRMTNARHFDLAFRRTFFFLFFSFFCECLREAKENTRLEKRSSSGSRSQTENKRGMQSSKRAGKSIGTEGSDPFFEVRRGSMILFSFSHHSFRLFLSESQNPCTKERILTLKGLCESFSVIIKERN